MLIFSAIMARNYGKLETKKTTKGKIGKNSRLFAFFALRRLFCFPNLLTYSILPTRSKGING
jgi:hypothetical protein